MSQMDTKLIREIKFRLKQGNSWVSTSLADIVSVATGVRSTLGMSPERFRRIVHTIADDYGIRIIVPRCIGLKRLETFFAREGRETAVAVRAAMRLGFERRRSYHVSHDVADYLESVLDVCGKADLYGVESLYPELPDIWYLNAGDPYTETLVYNSETHSWSLNCWDNIVERAGL